MTNEQILKKALIKAMGNGMRMVIDADRWITQEHYFELIFSHDFAKAFWGEEERWVMKIGDKPIKGEGKYLPWQYHLTQMVLEPEPLKYLSKFLEEEK